MGDGETKTAAPLPDTHSAGEGAGRAGRWFAWGVALLVLAGGVKAWVNYREVHDQRARRRALLFEERASKTFYDAVGRQMAQLPVPLTRAQFEGILPDSVPVSISAVNSQTAGEPFIIAVYHDPATGGEIEAWYADGQWRSMSPTTLPRPAGGLGPSQLARESEDVRILVARVSPWLCGALLVYWLFSRDAARRVSRSLAMLLAALAFTVAAYSLPWSAWSRSRIRGDELLWAGPLCVMVSLLFVRASLLSRDPGNALRCRTCGYDLRATPGRCPECGTVPA